MKTKILIIEDDPNIRFGLEEVLQSEGFAIAVCERGDQAVDAVLKEQPALVLLDIMLPGMSGYDVCKELRKRKISVLILMLTAKGQEIEKVVGLELGADDYLTKPFGVRELVARIRALLRRSIGFPSTPASFTIGDSLIDPKTLTLSRGHVRENLTARELHLLQIFHAAREQVLSRDWLLSKVWGYEYYGTTRTLDQVIVQLRKKLGESGEPKLLLTVHGIGYRLRGERQEEFGYTKQRYFQLLEQFEARGALALQSTARGPKTNQRRTEEMVRRIIHHRFLDPDASAEVIAHKLQQAPHLISVRSVEWVISDFGLQKIVLDFFSGVVWTFRESGLRNNFRASPTAQGNPPGLYNRPRRRRRPRGRLRIGADGKAGHRIEGRGKSKRREFRSYHWETGENEDDDETSELVRQQIL